MGLVTTGVAWGFAALRVPDFNPFSLDAGLYLMKALASRSLRAAGRRYRWISVAFSTPIHLAVLVSVVSTGGITGIIVALNVVVLTIILYRSCYNSENAFVESITRKLEATALATSLTAVHSDMLQANARLELLASCDPAHWPFKPHCLQLHAWRRPIREARDNDGKLGLLVVDLDRFKHVNDTMGHKAGDSLLTEFAQRLRNALPTGKYIHRKAGRR